MVRKISLGSKISALRTNSRLSQEELGFELGVSQTTVSNFESDKYVPDFIIMEKIANFFNVALDHFLEGTKVFNVKKNVGDIVGDNGTINNNVPEGILENMLKRIKILESKYK
jgi:transcriptional regulator with XRE-family HTH domain